ncbi:MAG: radical SAM protein [Sodaliphilus sp.]
MASSAPIIGIVRHSINVDGGGVCSLVAFHTCTLACRYCLNPHSLTHPERCEVLTPNELYLRVKIDDLYFQASGGGITFGGGEPLLRAEFIAEFWQICPPSWHICVETALNVESRFLQMLLPVVHHYYIDIKDMNPAIYQRYTGHTNERVLHNLSLLTEHGLAERVTIRVPLIPGYNTAADQEKSINQLKEMGFIHFHKFTYITPKH